MSTRRSTRLSTNIKIEEYRCPQQTSDDEELKKNCVNTPSRKTTGGSRRSVLRELSPEVFRTPVSVKRKTNKRQSSNVINVNVSPPKQQKSPSRLLDRLCIKDSDTEDDNNNNDDIEDKLQSTDEPKAVNKYYSASRVLNSGATNNLPGRENEIQQIEQFLDEHLTNNTSGSLYISGQPGTGKTACLSKLLNSDQFATKLNPIYINCTSISTVGSVYNKIKTELKIKSVGRTEKDNLAAVEKYLSGKHKPVLLVLDEIDQLCSTKQSVLYTIFEWPSKSQYNIILIGIANSLDLTDRLLIRLNSNCNLRPRLMHFSSYSKQQIIDIFKSRLEEANVMDLFPQATIHLLAGKVASVSGDVRRALDIGRRVIEMAERDGKKATLNLKEIESNILNSNGDKQSADPEANEKAKDAAEVKPVQITQVASVLNNVYGTSQTLNDDNESNFPLQQKILLCSLLLILRKSKNKDITVGRLHDVYKRVCAKRNILSVDQAEFAGLCALVDTRGIIRLIKKKEPRLNKITLQWDQTEVTDSLKDKQLIATILDDDSCLGGR